MAADVQNGNVALLIDADNASADHFDAVLTVLAELGTVNIRRAYGNWTKPTLKRWADLSVTQAIEPYQQFDLTKGKNATDMRMTIDAMDLMFGGRIDAFGLMSSDSDFTPLANRIRQQGLDVYGFGMPSTPQGFRQACTRFIDVTALVAADEPAPAALAPASEAAPVVAGAKAPAVDEALVNLLSAAWKASKRDERNFASLSEVGQRAANRSSFDKRNYGVSNLSALFAQIPNFEVERRENGHAYVRRVR